MTLKIVDCGTFKPVDLQLRMEELSTNLIIIISFNYVIKVLYPYSKNIAG